MFNSCSAQVDGGGALFGNCNVTCLSSGQPCISGCFFTNCNATTWNGGGIYIRYPPTEFKMQNTIFISCEAGSWGGGFYFRPSTVMKNFTNFYFCFFDNNSGIYGNDSALNDEDYNQYTNNPFVYSFTTSTNNYRFYFNNKNADTKWKKDWLPTGTLNRYVKYKSGINKEDCGIKEDENESKCKTVEYSIGLISSSGKWWIKVLDDVLEDSPIEIDINLFVNITGNDKKFSINNSNKDSSLFSICGCLYVSTLTLISKDSSTFSLSSSADVELVNVLFKCLNFILIFIFFLIIILSVLIF